MAPFIYPDCLGMMRIVVWKLPEWKRGLWINEISLMLWKAKIGGAIKWWTLPSECRRSLQKWEHVYMSFSFLVMLFFLFNIILIDMSCNIGKVLWLLYLFQCNRCYTEPTEERNVFGTLWLTILEIYIYNTYCKRHHIN